MDDLEDIETDLSESRATVFTQTAGRWPMDGLTNRIFHFGRATFGDLSPFHSAAVETMAELIERGIEPVLIDIIGRAGKYYSKDYLRELERHMPYRFAVLKKIREKLGRQKINIGALIDTMM